MARPLTHRQVEVLELLAKGLTNPEIGRVLGIGLGTVKSHVSAVIESLGVSNRTEAAGLLAELELGRRAALPSPDAAVPGFGERPVIAMLPFEDLGTTTGSQWFARGLLADLTQRAGNVRWFPVIQLESALAVGEGVDAAALLGARYVIEGSVLRDADRLAVTVRGRDAASGSNVWAARFERPLAELEEVQAEIVARILHELEPAILRLEQVRCERRRADAIAVWDLCKRAEHHVERETPDAYLRAVAQFEEALALDRASSRAWAGLALAHASALYLGLADDFRKVSRRAHECADMAMQLAPEDFESQLSLGRSLALTQEDEAALPHLERALELDPSSSIAANTFAGALRRRGHAVDAIPWYERCIRLSPRSPQLYHVHGGLSLAHLASGDHAEALRCARAAVAGDPADGRGKALDFYPIVPASLALLGRIEEARAAWDAAGEHASPQRMRHSARFTGAGLEALAAGLRLAGWNGKLD